MKESFLSQEEVDALLEGVTGESQKLVDDIPEDGEVRAYNISSQERIVRGRMPTMEIVNERFARNLRIGLFNFIQNKGIQSLKDYSYGVEVGLDTNGRKNRGGSAMELLVEKLITPILLSHNCSFIVQGTQKEVFKKWGLHLPLDKSNRIVDFIINKNGKLIWVETNFYSAGGSKLKSTAGEYKDLFKFCKENNIEFVWITDGNGWISTRKPLKETFELTDYLLNLNMIKNGFFEDIIKQ